MHKIIYNKTDKQKSDYYSIRNFWIFSHLLLLALIVSMNYGCLSPRIANEYYLYVIGIPLIMPVIWILCALFFIIYSWLIKHKASKREAIKVMLMVVLSISIYFYFYLSIIP